MILCLLNYFFDFFIFMHRNFVQEPNSRYGDDDRAPGRITVLKAIAGDGTGLLIIDDLVDTGETARAVRDMLPKAHFATVYAKPAGRPLVDTFVTEVSQDTWIAFPWEQ